MAIKDMGLPVEYLKLRDCLRTYFRGKLAAGGKECVIRCPFCGDSKDVRDAHLYVGINRKKKNVISYNCFKCNASGDVGKQFFNILGINDQDIVESVLAYNQERGSDIYAQMRRHSGLVINKRNFTPRNSIIPIFDTPEYRMKLDYINQRIGSALTLYDLIPYRIILNLNDFLNANGIRDISRDPRIMNELSQGFIGFLSIDSTHVTMRRIVSEDSVHPSLAERYVNYTINDMGSQIYCIREAIDTMLPHGICICEGPFDALSIHYNLLFPYMNKLVIAACGKDIQTVLEYLVLKKGMDFFNATFHIYIDNDLHPKDLAGMRNLMRGLNLKTYWHRNISSGEKDFGVPAARIYDTLF